MTRRRHPGASPQRERKRVLKMLFDETGAEVADFLQRGRGSWRADLTRCDLCRDTGACFVACDAWQRQLQVVRPVGFGFIQHYSL